MALRVLAIFVLILSEAAQSGSEICPNTPLPRLMSGGRGEVAPGIERLRLRALPAVGTGEVSLLYAGNTFEVIAGPSCNGGYSWWRVVMEDGTTGWVAEGDWTQYYLRPVSDNSRTLCKRADAPWLHLLLTAGCTLLSAL
jgi:hypothetical protein